MGANNFMDLDTLGLRRSLRNNNGKDPKRLVNTMMTLASAAFMTKIALDIETVSHCYQDRAVEYED